MGSKPFRFECTGCGNCCRGRGEVYFTEEDLSNIETLLALKSAEKPAFRRKMVQSKRNGLLVHLTNGRCALLGNDNRCSVYEARPIQCRTYPFWAGFFENEDDMDFLKNECEGVGRRNGKVYSELSIKRRTNKTERDFRALQNGKEPFSL